MSRQRMLAIVLAGLMLALTPQAVADDENLRLELSLEEAPEKGWYAPGDIVTIASTLFNDGESTSIDTDPSCGEVLRVLKSSEIIFDGTTACNGQSRGLDLGPSSSTVMESLSWDLTDSNGDLVSPGDYTVEYIIAGEELSSSVEVHVQTLMDIPEGVFMEANYNSRTGIISSDSPTIITLRMVNTLNQNVQVDLQGCLVTIDEVLYQECLPGDASLYPYEIRTISHIPLMLEAGEQTLSVALGAGLFNQLLTLDVEQGRDLGIHTGDLSDALVEVEIQNEDSTYGEDGLLESTVVITNLGSQDITLDFTDTCRGEIWVIDASGAVVMDTRLLKTCEELDVQNLIQPDTTRTFSQPGWNFLDTEGCKIDSGKLMIIAEIPEYQVFGTTQFDFERASASNCGEPSIEISPKLNELDEDLKVDISLTSNDNSEIAWISACGLELTLSNSEGEVERILTHCQGQEVVVQRISSSIDLESAYFDMSELGDDVYNLQISTISSPMISQVQTFNWPLDTEESEIIEQEEAEEEVLIISTAGTWAAVSTDSGVCWLLENQDGNIMTLANIETGNDWSPKAGINGQYLVSQSTSSPECSSFAAESFTVVEVTSEQKPVVEIEETSAPEVESSIEEEATINPVVITIGSVVASTGILTLLFATIATNESWRIPATSAGLWLLGLVGRTSETSDGRYQRGRLTGYLTANPGCHFRALMAALDMSNGQITHHLKVLEQEERVWRRADGRLVRFYPYTSNLHPGVDEDDLPLPPLSPDPNSLQGKILRLLDDDGQMGDFPTQAELANRLDRSQQLVSHHLRTLQRFGLVEKRKMGMRNRYCLTKEAVFLLETTEL